MPLEMLVEISFIIAMVGMMTFGFCVGLKTVAYLGGRFVLPFYLAQIVCEMFLRWLSFLPFHQHKLRIVSFSLFLIVSFFLMHHLVNRFMGILLLTKLKTSSSLAGAFLSLAMFLFTVNLIVYLLNYHFHHWDLPIQTEFLDFLFTLRHWL